MSDTVTPGRSLRCVWEVTAGLIVGQAIPELSKTWQITNEYMESLPQELSQEEWKERFPDGTKFYQFQQAAYAYARSLSNPSQVNWVKVEWIWL
jgi:hypothetical protein